MRYHCGTIFGAALTVLAASPLANAQTPAGPGIFGFYDPASGNFQAVTLQTMPSGDSTAADTRSASPRAGKIHFKIIIKVLSGSPATTLPSCFFSFSHSGVQRSYSESASMQGSRTGDNAVCDLLVPYSWPVANTASPVNLSVSISVGNRSHGESTPPIPLPANGAVTNVTLNVTS